MSYKFTIDKEFAWEMGHRVWAQELPHSHLSITTDCACKHLHGHSYTIKVFLGANELDQSSMVTDFKNLNFMKSFVDNVLDHKFMIDKNDPHFELITTCKASEVSDIANFTNLGGLNITNDPARQLHLQSFVVVDFCPTSENICKYIKEYAHNIIKEVATVTAVELWETKKSHCRYQG